MGLEHDESKEMVSILQRALFYESQYRNAVVSDALSFYDVNVTKDLIEIDFFYKDNEGKFYSTLEKVGLSAPCLFSDFINAWTTKMISRENRKKYPFINNIRQQLLDSFEQGKRDFIVEYWADIKPGRKMYINQRFLLTQNEMGEVCALSIVKDYTKLKTQEEETHRKQLEHFAFYDPITHGYNYIKFKERLKEIDTPGSIISVDIHSFKVVNSIAGIIKGDKVIEAIWLGIENVLDLKKNDLAGHINADQFIIFMPTFDHALIEKRLRNLTYVMSFISADMNIPQLEPYFGIATWNPEKRIELAYSESMAAKKNAKHAEKNFAYFNEKDNIRLVKEKKILDNFTAAMVHKEFRLYYQPKYNPGNRLLVGAEALVRWVQDDGSILGPNDFIPLFEKNGLIREFDEYIFKNVCLQLKKWKDEGKNIVPISINLSRASLYYKEIVSEYKRISEEIGIDTAYIPIEITESAAITNNEIKDIAEKFYQAGFILHMDDFGSGYSSLATLNIMHFDTLKLDKSLIDYIGNFGGERLIEHTVLLAKELGMHITAEGVEEENQVSFLKQIGCDSIQGYFYSKPITSDKFELLLTKVEQAVPVNPESIVVDKINKFKQSISKQPLYSCTVNLSTNELLDVSLQDKGKVEDGFLSKNFDESVQIVLERYVNESCKDGFLKFTNRTEILRTFDRTKTQEISIFPYEGKQLDNDGTYILIKKVFRIEGNDNLWAYFGLKVL